MAHRLQLNAIDKVFVCVAWAIAGAIFFTVGWRVMEPDDPLGPVSLLTHNHAIVMWLQAAVLTGMTAALATIIAGRRLADVGIFASSLGLAVVSLRGTTAGFWFVRGSDQPGTIHRGLAFSLALESLAWFLLILLAVVVSAVVMRWLYPVHPGVYASKDDDLDVRHIAVCGMSAFDTPFLSQLSPHSLHSERTDLRVGLYHFLIAAGAGIPLFVLLTTSQNFRAIEHGQACFLAAATVCLAAYLAHTLMPVRSSLWSILAVPVIAMGGYFWAGINASTMSHPNIPWSRFLRVLPIQYISVGSAAALAMFWHMYIPVFRTQPKKDGKSSRRSS